MKTRQGFVSNSSSSSFIAIVDQGVEPKVYIEVDLSEVGVVANSASEVLALFRGELCWEPEDGEWEDLTKCLEAVRDGKSVVIGSVASDGDDYGEIALYQGGFPDTDGVDVIRGGGY